MPSRHIRVKEYTTLTLVEVVVKVARDVIEGILDDDGVSESDRDGIALRFSEEGYDEYLCARLSECSCTTAFRISSFAQGRSRLLHIMTDFPEQNAVDLHQCRSKDLTFCWWSYC